MVAAVRFARDHDLEIAIRVGGHNVAGTAVRDDGIVIDLSAMRTVQAIPPTAGPGCRVVRSEVTSITRRLSRLDAFGEKT
jgi:FAD/FMN-containing dehydrogenase